MHLVLLHFLVFSPFGVTQAEGHVTNHEVFMPLKRKTINPFAYMLYILLGAFRENFLKNDEGSHLIILYKEQ